MAVSLSFVSLSYFFFSFGALAVYGDRASCGPRATTRRPGSGAEPRRRCNVVQGGGVWIGGGGLQVPETADVPFVSSCRPRAPHSFTGNSSSSGGDGKQGCTKYKANGSQVRTRTQSVVRRCTPTQTNRYGIYHWAPTVSNFSISHGSALHQSLMLGIQKCKEFNRMGSSIV